MSSNIGLAFNDPYYTSLFVISILTFILDVMVIFLNYRYNSNKTNILFTAVNVCISSWLRCFSLISTWQHDKVQNNQVEPLFNFCSIMAAVSVTFKISQDIWVCILGISFYSELINPTINESKENRKKWLIIKILSYAIAVFIPGVIAIILFFNGFLGLGNICCWIKTDKDLKPLREIFRYSLLSIKWIAILLNGFFCFKVFMNIRKIYPSLKDDKQKKDLKKLQIILFSFPINQLFEVPFSTASTFLNTDKNNPSPSIDEFKRFVFVLGGIQSLCYSISFFFFTNGWDNIKKMCNKNNNEIEKMHSIQLITN